MEVQLRGRLRPYLGRNDERRLAGASRDGCGQDRKEQTGGPPRSLSGVVNSNAVEAIRSNCRRRHWDHRPDWRLFFRSPLSRARYFCSSLFAPTGSQARDEQWPVARRYGPGWTTHAQVERGLRGLDIQHRADHDLRRLGSGSFGGGGRAPSARGDGHGDSHAQSDATSASPVAGVAAKWPARLPWPPHRNSFDMCCPPHDIAYCLRCPSRPPPRVPHRAAPSPDRTPWV